MKMTILTIEDQADIRRLIRMTLEFEGIDVIEAGNGAEGLVLARRHRPDLILLDVMMPGLSGLQVSQALAADPALSHIPVLMLTALAQDGDVAAGLAAGARAYLTKPFSPMELLNVVQGAVGVAQTAA